MARASVRTRTKTSTKIRKRTAKSGGKKIPAKSSRKEIVVLVGTRKGAFLLRSDSSRRKWALEGPHFLGCIIHHMVLDPRDRKTLVVACRTGHLGPTVYRSSDLGKSWLEAERPP